MEQPFSGEDIRARLLRQLNRFLDSLELTWVTLRPNARWITIFGLVTHPVYLVVNNALGNGDDSLTLRVLAFCACALAVFLPEIERVKGKRVAAWLAVTIIFFALPFFFLWVLAENSLNENIGATELASRQVQCAFAIMATALLIYDRRVLIIGLTVCFILVGVIFILNNHESDLSSLRGSIFSQLPFWIFAVVAGSYFNRNRAVVEREKYKTLSDTGGYLAHELRTPLASVSMKLHGLNRFLEEQKNIFSLEDHATKEDALNLIDRLTKRTSSLADGAIDDVVYANQLIDMFLVRAGVVGSNVDMETKFLVSKCVEEAYSRYPFASIREKQSTRVIVEEDFQISAPFLLMTHVILNLLKNALGYAPLSANSEVVVRISQANNVGCIDVKDNGPGIPLSEQARIFDSFYTTTSAGEGAGIGLHFCKSVISEIGGTLTVKSVPNVETVFSIRIKVPPS